MTGSGSLLSFSLSVVSLSTPASDIAESELSNHAPVTVIDDNVSTEESLRTFSKLDFFSKKISVTVGEIIEAEPTLCDVTASHSVSLEASIEKNSYDYRRGYLSVILPSPANENAEG